MRGTAPTKVSQTFVKKEKKKRKKIKKRTKREKDNKDVKPKITASYSGGAISVNWSASNAASDTTLQSQCHLLTVLNNSHLAQEPVENNFNPAAGATYSFTVTTNTGESASSSVKSLIHQIKLPKIILLSLKMTEQRTIIKMKTIATLIKTTALIKVTIHLLSRMITKTAIMAAIVTVAIAVITAIPIITITIAAILTMVITTIITGHNSSSSRQRWK